MRKKIVFCGFSIFPSKFDDDKRVKQNCHFSCYNHTYILCMYYIYFLDKMANYIYTRSYFKLDTVDTNICSGNSLALYHFLFACTRLSKVHQNIFSFLFLIQLSLLFYVHIYVCTYVIEFRKTTCCNKNI